MITSPQRNFMVLFISFLTIFLFPHDEVYTRKYTKTNTRKETSTTINN